MEILITPTNRPNQWFKKPKKPMFQLFDKLQIVTVQQILDGESINLPLLEEVTKKAQKAKTDKQSGLFGIAES